MGISMSSPSQKTLITASTLSEEAEMIQSDPLLHGGTPQMTVCSVSNSDWRRSRITDSLIVLMMHFRQETAFSYTEYAPRLVCTVEAGTNVWWFPADFCQSRLGDRETGSNACTLIAVILAHRIERQGVSFFEPADLSLSRRLVTALAESIVDGNDIYERLASDGVLHEMDLTLPEALSICGRCSTAFNCLSTNKRLVEWRSAFQMEPMSKQLLFEDLHRGIFEWETKFCARNTNLYAVIIGGGRSILFVYQNTTAKVTLFDSHAHVENSSGAVVAQTSTGQLKSLCNWYVDTNRRMRSGNDCPSYEVSFLHFVTEKTSGANQNSICSFENKI